MSARAFTMPKWGIEMREGALAKGLIAAGQPFALGDLLALVETDKITNEIEAEFGGVLRRAIVSEGAAVPAARSLVYSRAQARTWTTPRWTRWRATSG